MRERSTQDECGEWDGTHSTSHANEWRTPACSSCETATAPRRFALPRKRFALPLRANLKRKNARALSCRLFV